jgi:hypothetical protein
LLDSIFRDKKIFGFETRDKLMCLIEDNVDVEVNDGDVYAERVGLVIRILYLGLSWRRRRGRLICALFFLFDNDGSIIGLRTSGIIRSLLLGRRGGLLGVKRGESEGEKGCEQKCISQEVRAICHHLKLYSGSAVLP